MSGTLGTMNPNSAHQRWSRWTFFIRPGGSVMPSFKDIKHAAALFGRLEFKSATEMNIQMVQSPLTGKKEIHLRIRTEGHPVHDPQFVQWMHGRWTRWAERGFGPRTTCELIEAKLEAGDRQDGTPRDQLILMDHAALPRIVKENGEWTVKSAQDVVEMRHKDVLLRSSKTSKPTRS